MTRRIALIAALPALLTSCLLDQYNPSAIEGDDSGPYIEGDADTDADTDSDTDADVNIDIASVTPDYATTRGGVEITIVGGPFGTGATVLIGDTQATVSNAQETVIQAIVPSMSETGVLDLEVRTDDGLGRLDDGFTVIEDGTGLTGAIGEFYWIDYKGEYWNPAPPDDAGGAGISQTGALVGARQPRAEAGAGLEDPAAVATGRANKEYLEAIATPLRSSGLTVETEVLFGHVVDRVIAAIDAHNIDMVALSTHARTGLARTIMGSVAEQLVRQSNKPVLLVRPEGA